MLVLAAVDDRIGHSRTNVKRPEAPPPTRLWAPARQAPSPDDQPSPAAQPEADIASNLAELAVSAVPGGSFGGIG